MVLLVCIIIAAIFGAIMLCAGLFQEIDHHYSKEDIREGIAENRVVGNRNLGYRSGDISD